MNLHEAVVLRTLKKEAFVSQRTLAESCGLSVGAVNKAVKELIAEGFLDSGCRLTGPGRDAMAKSAPKNAIILAAGFGMRMVPINLSTPKALIEVNGEKLIERTIRQLHEAGIREITVVAGFMKDSFEYLIDEFGVDLVVNNAYAAKNNLHSLALAAKRIRNSYIIPCDIWCAENPYSDTELYSWYMVSEEPDEDSSVRVNRKTELVRVGKGETGNRMIGIAYLTGPEAETVRETLKEMDENPAFETCFWEEALYKKDRMILQARVVPAAEAVEINTYEQLRDLDAGSGHLKSGAIRTIAETLQCSETEITDISVLKKGMTNRSFLFTVKGKQYIMRIPGEGTDKLINRRNEAAVYEAIKGRGLCDDPVYLNPEDGCKITAFLPEVRVCDAENEEDLKRCMAKLRAFHGMKLTVSHDFDIFGQIDFYESLWEGAPSVYRDYAKTKEKVLALKPYIEKTRETVCLTHIDAVPDNFLFYRDENGTEQLQLTDWEYSGMQDPHADIAMFAIYSLYDRAQTDHLIDLYFEGKCDSRTRAKIYCYVAACGLLWSNWCEYKRKLGVEFGEYSLRQYRYAKDFCRYAEEYIIHNS